MTGAFDQHAHLEGRERPETPALRERDADDVDVPVEETDPEDAHRLFKERYDLRNKEEVYGFLRANGKIVGAPETDRGKTELWNLRDGVTATWNKDKERIDGFVAEYNKRMMAYIRREGHAYISREELEYPPREEGDA